MSIGTCFLLVSAGSNVQKREESKILSTEIGRLRKLQKLKNETVRNKLEHAAIHYSQSRGAAHVDM